MLAYICENTEVNEYFHLGFQSFICIKTIYKRYASKLA